MFDEGDESVENLEDTKGRPVRLVLEDLRSRMEGWTLIGVGFKVLGLGPDDSIAARKFCQILESLVKLVINVLSIIKVFYYVSWTTAETITDVAKKKET